MSVLSSALEATERKTGGRRVGWVGEPRRKSAGGQSSKAEWSGTRIVRGSDSDAAAALIADAAKQDALADVTAGAIAASAVIAENEDSARVLLMTPARAKKYWQAKGEWEAAIAPVAEIAPKRAARAKVETVAKAAPKRVTKAKATPAKAKPARAASVAPEAVQVASDVFGITEFAAALVAAKAATARMAELIVETYTAGATGRKGRVIAPAGDLDAAIARGMGSCPPESKRGRLIADLRPRLAA